MSRLVAFAARIEADAARRKATRPDATARKRARSAAYHRTVRREARKKCPARVGLAVLKDAPPEVVTAFRTASHAVRRLIIEQYADAARPFTTSAPDADSVYAVTVAP